MIKTLLRKARVALTPESALLRTKLSNGAIVDGYNRAGYGGRGVYIHGDSLEPELASLDKFLGPGFVFVDIGANVGVYTVKAAKEVGESGLVIAIEPFIDSAHRLSRNVRTNAYRNVRVRNVCVGGSTGAAKFYLNQGKPNSYGLFQDSGAEELSVLVVSLDDLCQWEGILRLDYLKIDAEGAEALILEGGMESLKRFRPIIQVEVTLTGVPTPEDYERFSPPGGINNLFVPTENREAISAARSLGWSSTQDRPAIGSPSFA